MIIEKYLPLGSVVLLNGGKKRLMIYGRRQRQAGEDREWDYAACLFPEGNIDASQTYLFDHEQIERICYLGLCDEEEMQYQDNFLQKEEQQ